MQGSELLELVTEVSDLLKGAEDKTVNLFNKSLDTAYTNLEKRLEKLYEKAVEDINTSSAFRLRILIEQLGDILSIVEPTKADFYRERLEKLIELGQTKGLNLSHEIANRFSGGDLGKLSLGVNKKAVKFAAENAEKRLSSHNEAFRQQAINIIGYHLAVGSGTPKMTRDLRDAFGLVKYRAEAIARTETLSALNEGTDYFYTQQGVEYVQFFATSDERTCQYCGYRNQSIYKRGEIQAPLHVNCRCMCVAIKSKWIEKGLVDFKWAEKYHAEAGEAITSTDSGLAPFEKANRVSSPPKPLWKPGQPPPKLPPETSNN